MIETVKADTEYTEGNISTNATIMPYGLIGFTTTQVVEGKQTSTVLHFTPTGVDDLIAALRKSRDKALDDLGLPSTEVEAEFKSDSTPPHTGYLPPVNELPIEYVLEVASYLNKFGNLNS